MTKIIAFANHKGGVAKTTSVMNVGSILSQMGKRVLLMDLDAQANLTGSLLREEPESSIYEALLGKRDSLPVIPITDSLSIVPSSENMASIELLIANRMEREYLLKDLLKPIASSYDYILLDCPPSLGLITLNAFVAATDLYIPLNAEVLPFKGLDMIADVLSMVQKRANPTLRLSGIIITRYEKSNLSQNIEKNLRSAYGDIVFNAKIRKNVAIAEAPLYIQDVNSYAPNSNGAKDYKALTTEILSKTK